MPHKNAETETAVEEERRLFYVGLTRARECACVTLARTRYLWGNVDYARPSLFLSEFPHTLAGGGAEAAPGAAAPAGPSCAEAGTPGDASGLEAELADDFFPDGPEPDGPEADIFPDGDDLSDWDDEGGEGDPAVRSLPSRRLRPGGGKAAKAAGGPIPAWKAALQKSLQAITERRRRIGSVAEGAAGAADGGASDAADWEALRVGRAVRHPVFGPGVVEARGGQHVVVRFRLAGKKNLHRAHCRLTPEGE